MLVILFQNFTCFISCQHTNINESYTKCLSNYSLLTIVNRQRVYSVSCKLLKTHAAKTLLYSFLPSIISLLCHLSLLLSRPASFNQYSSRTNANKHLRIHHHLRVLVSRGLSKAFTLLYFTFNAWNVSTRPLFIRCKLIIYCAEMISA